MEEHGVRKDNADKYSLSGRVFHRIREDILSGKYEKGEELKEIAIGNELGVSRTPVREALRQLELEGLVNIIPNKGAYVVGLSAKDIQDIYTIRSLLEGLCARWAAESITAEQLKALEENVDLSEFYATKGNFDHVFELDSQFHEIMYEASGSKTINHLLSDYHHYVQRVRRVTIATEGRAYKSNGEHRNILNAIKARNPLEAERLATAHVMNTMNNIKAYGLENILAEADKKQELQGKEQG